MKMAGRSVFKFDIEGNTPATTDTFEFFVLKIDGLYEAYNRAIKAKCLVEVTIKVLCRYMGSKLNAIALIKRVIRLADLIHS
jgi:hypothetical protein